MARPAETVTVEIKIPRLTLAPRVAPVTVAPAPRGSSEPTVELRVYTAEDAWYDDQAQALFEGGHVEDGRY